MLHTYHDVAPSPELKPCVQAYRVDAHRPGSPLPTCRILPDGGGCLLIKRFDPAVRITPHFTTQVVGPRSVYVDVSLQRRSLTVAVLFRPGGARALLGLGVTALTDHSTPLAEARPVLADRLRRTLPDASSTPKTLRLLNRTLKSLRPSSAPPPTVQAATDRWRVRPAATVREVASNVGVSARHLRSLFERHVGHAPKRFGRVQRIRLLVRRLRTVRSGSWTDLALDAGFYDQSHMIRELDALLGETPTELNRRIRRTPPPVSPDDLDRPFRFLQDMVEATP
jgi:AraC-like DNA-binding protein